MAAKVLWMMAHRGLMLLMTGEPNGSLSPQTGTAPSVVAEALEVGERKAKTKGRMQVSSQIIMSFETQAVICMQHSLPGILSLLHLCLCCRTMMTCSSWLHMP